MALGLLVLLASTTTGARVAVAGIRAYQSTVSPLVAQAGLQCRFTVSCSHYAEVVIERDGVLIGGWKTAKRLARCGPWTPLGTRDDP